MKCIVGEGQQWRKCPNHTNSNGDHGTYMCIWMLKEEIDHKPWRICDCSNPKNIIMQFDDKDFEL